MIRTELRIVLAVIATFVSLAGIAVVIHGALYDRTNAMLYGGVATGAGIVISAVLLNVWPKDMNDKR
jgi:hypothetical protein